MLSCKLFAFNNFSSNWRLSISRLIGLIFCLLLSNYALANASLCGQIAFSRLEKSKVQSINLGAGVGVLYSLEFNGRVYSKMAIANHLTAHATTFELSLRALAKELDLIEDVDFKDTEDLTDYFTNITVWWAGEYKAHDGKFTHLNETSGTFGDKKHDTEMTQIEVARIKINNTPRSYAQKAYIDVFAQINPHLFSNLVYVPYVKDSINRLDPAIEQLKQMRHEFIGSLARVTSSSDEAFRYLSIEENSEYFVMMIDQLIEAAKVVQQSSGSQSNFSNIADFFTPTERKSVETLQALAKYFINLDKKIHQNLQIGANDFSAQRVAEFLVAQDNANYDSIAVITAEVKKAADAVKCIIDNYRKPIAAIQNI